MFDCLFDDCFLSKLYFCQKLAYFWSIEENNMPNYDKQWTFFENYSYGEALHSLATSDSFFQEIIMKHMLRFRDLLITGNMNQTTDHNKASIVCKITSW